MVFCMNIHESHQMKVKYVIQHVIRELNNYACVHEHLHNIQTLCMTLGPGSSTTIIIAGCFLLAHSSLPPSPCATSGWSCWVRSCTCSWRARGHGCRCKLLKDTVSLLADIVWYPTWLLQDFWADLKWVGTSVANMQKYCYMQFR